MAAALAALAAAGTLPIVAAAQVASGTPVSTLQHRAARIATQIAAANAKLQVLSEEYDQARLRHAALGRQIATDTAAIGTAHHTVERDTRHLRDQAVAAYVAAGSAAGLSVIMTGSASSLPLQQTYLQAASGSLSTAITSLHDSEHRLSVREATLASARSRAAASERTLASARGAANALLGQLTSTRQQLSGQLAAAVAAQQRIQSEQAAARAAAQQAAAPTVAQAAAQPAPPVAPPVAPPSAAPTAPSGAQGDVAVRSAESQIGVPYVWAGATAGQGFDCSGLTMWAWGQAGVNLPHSAQAQYDSIEHVSLDALQPGDLIFYASGGYIYHVTMYVGGGQMVQAEDTGTTIQITPVWGGAYGAGRP